MKRKLLSILLTFCLAFSLLPTAALANEATGCVGGENCSHQAAIGDKHYDTLKEAVAAAPMVAQGEQLPAATEITVLRDVTTSFDVGRYDSKYNQTEPANASKKQNVAIDLNNHKMTLAPSIGSTNTETNGLRSLKGSNLLLKNGEIYTECSFSNQVKVMIANYGGLKLDHINLTHDGTTSNAAYTINNAANLTVKSSTITCNVTPSYASADIYAIVSSDYATDVTAVNVSFDENSTVNGIFALYNINDSTTSNIDFKGTLNGAILTLPEDATKLPTFNGDLYASTACTLAAEINQAQENSTIKLANDIAANVTIPTGKNITLDLNGNKLTNIDDNTITVENGATLTVTGTGTVDNVTHGKAAVYNKGTITLAGGTYERSAEAGKDANNDGGNSFYTVLNHGDMTVEADVVVNNKGKYSSLFENGYYNYNNSDGVVNPKLTINGGTFDGGLNTIKNDDNATLTIKGGTFQNYTQAAFQNHHIATVEGGTFIGRGSAKAVLQCGVCNGTDDTHDKHELTISSGYFFGEITKTVGTITITGGYFTSDPSAYVAESKYVIKSDKAGYTYAVTDTEPEETPIFVDENTTHDTSAITDETTKSAIDAVINRAKVEGVAAAVDESALVASKVDTSEVDAAKKVEVEVSVKVEVKSADLSGENAAKTLTFEAKPVATIKVDGTEKATDVAVPNSLLSGDITVKLPLPTVDGKLFTPEQIKHISSDGSVEYFLRTAKSGAKTFEIKDGCAVFTITKFSTFELSGVVTYVEPSYSSGSSSDPTYSVSTPSKTEHGSVTVSPKSASKGDTVTVTVKPDSGYVLETLTVTDKNGNELTLKDKGNGKYTFTMPAGKVEVKATFMEDNSMLNFFYDVPNGAYFYEAVKWAVENGITDGVGNDLFAPEQPCTRAQIVTFLWRAAGSPEPKGAASGMTDVVSGSYYEKAVAWAIENGITTGTTTSTFSPDATCTRAQAVTFLARALKAKAASAAEFSDVPTGSYFADAVAWAAANGVTEGIGGGLFGSDNDCTRGQIVTFLYRAYNK